MNARIALWLALGSLLPSTAAAVPVFARKYGVNCTLCHSAYPRLNDFGTRFRMNGYQLPGKESEERTVLETPAPFAARISGGFDLVRQYGAASPEDVTQFRLEGLDLLSAGVLGRHLGYLAVYVPPIPAARGLAGQEGTLEMASAVFRHLGTSWLNLRVGRFEPAYVAFSAKRQLSASPYEIYGFASPGGPAMDETQEGLELWGWGRGGVRYAAGWVNGASSNLLRDVPADAYLRLWYVLGEGEGQTAGQRLGITGQVGLARPQANQAAAREAFFRVAADASLNLRQWNLALQAVWTRDPASLWAAGGVAPSGTALDIWGGFAELSFMPEVSWVLFARGDAVFVPPETGRGEVLRTTAGARFYPVDNLAVHLEYSYRREAPAGTSPELTDHLATARVDFAF